MPGNRLFDPSGSLSIRPPQDDGGTSDKIRNPPRYMQFGGLSGGNVRGFMNNDMKIQMPGNTQSKVPFDRKRGKF